MSQDELSATAEQACPFVSDFVYLDGSRVAMKQLQLVHIYSNKKLCTSFHQVLPDLGSSLSAAAENVCDVVNATFLRTVAAHRLQARDVHMRT